METPNGWYLIFHPLMQPEDLVRFKPGNGTQKRNQLIKEYTRKSKKLNFN
jgi:hypothetical protein